MICKHRSLGLISYSDALALQWQLHAEVLASIKSEAPVSYLLTMEHPKVITLGKNSSRKHILVSSRQLSEAGWGLEESQRGGEVTLHAPGQLVAYFIAPLSFFSSSVRSLIDFLSGRVIETLAKNYEVTGAYDDKWPGVWIGEAKIAALGVQVRNRVSLHGLAINIDNGLADFNLIRACGLSGKSVTSLSSQLSRKVKLAQFRDLFVDSFRSMFDIEEEI